MTKKLLGVFTTIIAALAVVGVAWASGDDGTPTSVTGVTTASASVSSDVSTPSTDVTVADSSTSTSVNSSTSTSVDDNGGDRDDDRYDDDSPATSTSIASPTSTSVEGTTSTSIDDDDDDDDDPSTTSTTIDDDDRVVVPDGMTTHTIPGVGIVTIEAFAGELSLTAVSAPGWNVEREKIEKDRIELEFTNGLDAEAEFEAKINDGRIEVRIEVDSD